MQNHFKRVHSWAGLLTVFIAFLTPVLGFIQLRVPAMQAGTLRPRHRLLGRLLNLTALITLLLGLRMAGLI